MKYWLTHTRTKQLCLLCSNPRFILFKFYQCRVLTKLILCSYLLNSYTRVAYAFAVICFSYFRETSQSVALKTPMAWSEFLTENVKLKDLNTCWIIFSLQHAIQGRSFYSPAVLKLKCGYSITHQQGINFPDIVFTVCDHTTHLDHLIGGVR